MYLQQATPPKNYQPAAHGTANKSVKAGMGGVSSWGWEILFQKMPVCTQSSGPQAV